MGLFDDLSTERIHRQQVRFDDDEEVVSVKYGEDMSSNTKTQNMVQTALLSELVFNVRRQNQLLERQNKLLEEMERE